MLTELACKNAKPKEKPYPLADGGGMYLEVATNGSKYWRMKYRYAGSQKKLAFGVYPQVTLAEAREKRMAAKKLLAAGTDPSMHKQEQKIRAFADANNTFETIAKMWFDHKSKGISKRYGDFMWGRIEKDIFPAFGKKPIKNVSSLDIIQALKHVENRGVHELARRLKQSCDEIFRFAVSHGIIDSNPVRNFESRDVLVAYRKEHHACIEIGEIPEFLKALHSNSVRMYPLTRMAVELLMLTFVRTSELIDARWSEIDLKERQWVIPAERMKMRRPHLVPLSRQAVAILEELQKLSGQKQFVFPSMVDAKNKSMSNNTILQALTSMGYKGRMTGHGFRALAMSTIKEKLGYRHEVIDLQLAHAKGNKIDAAYDRAKFLDERRKMMQEWADYIEANKG
ncbi:MAG: DUF4102 domain-containing protein [Sphingobacteriales bacterium]|nr:MAG: DUF4102 domain-containing protein [Sphingobacteriales bacterium]